MRTRNSMKSVIAQGSSVAKAIEEALKKAGQPAEFFVKLLEDAQGGFLGFGAKKAKIALFFTQKASNQKKEGLLNQDKYQDLFDNKSLHLQIEDQIKQINTSKPQPSEQKTQPSKQHQRQGHQQTPRPMQQRPQHKQPSLNTSKPSQQKNEQKHPQPSQGPHKNFEQKKSHLPKQNNQQQAPKEKTTPSKLMVRPLPNKNNDSSKS